MEEGKKAPPRKCQVVEIAFLRLGHSLTLRRKFSELWAILTGQEKCILFGRVKIETTP